MFWKANILYNKQVIMSTTVAT